MKRDAIEIKKAYSGSSEDHMVPNADRNHVWLKKKRYYVIDEQMLQWNMLKLEYRWSTKFNWASVSNSHPSSLTMTNDALLICWLIHLITYSGESRDSNYRIQENCHYPSIIVHRIPRIQIQVSIKYRHKIC